jgi:GNAT superfamily N-acetyltransferase
MKTLSIRKPKASDLEGLTSFFQTVIPHTFVKAGLDEDHEDAIGEIKEKIKQINHYLDGSTASEYLVGLIDDCIIGTIWYGPSGDLIKSGSNGTLSHLGEIGTVFVAPDYQGKGIGKAMMAAMRDRLKEIGIDEVSLDSGYPQAQKVWLHIFGNPQYIMKDQWGEGLDHMIWKIEL